MDISNRVATWVTEYVRENPDVTKTVSQCISWGETLYPWVQQAAKAMDIEIPEGGGEAFKILRETLDSFKGPTEQVPEPETSVEIGGPGVEAEIASLRAAEQQLTASGESVTSTSEEEHTSELQSLRHLV